MTESTYQGAAPLAGAAPPGVLRATLAHPLAPFVGIVATYALATAAVLPLWDRPGLVDLALSASAFAVLATGFGLVLLVCRMVGAAWTDRRADPVHAAAVVVRRTVLADAPRAAVVVGCAALLLAATTGWRTAIPALHPFAWDDAFHVLDRWLHGGRLPWEYVDGFLVHPWGREALLIAYERVWFASSIGCMLALGWCPAGPRVQRFLVTFALTVIVLGVVVALLGSSAGPVYYARVLGLPPTADPYAPLLALLDAHAAGPLGPRVLQEHLWARYTSGDASVIAGITAFPSMHVATAVVFALGLGAWRWWAGAVWWGFVGLTLVGSVAYGWHYAVDGYASIVGVLTIWWAVGRWQRVR